MRQCNKLARLLIPLALFFAGCGDDFEAGNRLKIVSVTAGDGGTVFVLNAVETTDDTGADQQSGTGDVGENNGFWDEGETLEAPLGPDTATILFENETRLGVETGVDLSVYRVDVTYYDRNGSSRSFAPTQHHGVTVLVPTDATAELDIVLVSTDMKVGIREVFFQGVEANVYAARTWTAVLDVYARDVRNGDSVHAQASVPITFINPNVEAAPAN